MARKKRDEGRKVLYLSLALFFLVVLLGVSIYLLVHQDKRPVLFSPEDEAFVLAFDLDGNSVIEENDKAILEFAIMGDLENSVEVMKNIGQYLLDNKKCYSDTSECDSNFDFNNDGNVNEVDYLLLGTIPGDVENVNFDSILDKLSVVIDENTGLTYVNVDVDEVILDVDVDEDFEVFDVNSDGVVNEDDKTIISEALNGRGDNYEEINNNIHDFIWNNKRCNIVVGDCDLNYDFNNDGGIDTDDTFIFFDAAGNSSNDNFDVVLDKIMDILDEKIGLGEDEEEQIEEIEEIVLQCDVGYTINFTVCVNDKIIEYPEVYNITLGCGIENVTIPENVTGFDDCNDNMVIGHEGDIKVRNLNARVYIDEKRINNSKIYSSERKLVEIRDGDVAIIDFNFDFSDNLNLSHVRVEKSDDIEDDFGYLIVEGLSGQEKTFRIRKLGSGSDSVCIKDRTELGNITNSFSRKCSGSGEKIVECDGQEDEDGFECNIREINGEDYFVVSGLRNSGVKEVLPGETDTSTTSDSSSSSTSSSSSSGSSTSSLSNAGSSSSSSSSGSDPINVNNRFESTSGDEIDGSADGGSKIILWVVIGVLITSILIVGIILMMLVVHKKERPSNQFGQGVRVQAQQVRENF